MFFPPNLRERKSYRKERCRGLDTETKGDLKALFEDFCMSLRLVLWPLKGENASHF